MDQEIEVAAAASIGSFLKWPEPHLAAPGTPCANCETVLQGPYCHRCGQLAENFHRSLWHLAVEAVESFFHFDGRFWRTLPRLVRDPGGLTRDYLEGRRAGQIPPLRLFLVVLLLVFLLGGVGNDAQFAAAVVQRDGSTKIVKLTPDQASQVARSHINLDLGDARRSAAATNWLKSRLVGAARNPEQFMMVVETWAHRLAVLMLPIGAALLALLFALQRRFYFYDHLIFTMHSLSFQGLLLSAFFLIALASSPIAWLLLAVAAPAHLFVHMRGAYGTGVAGTLGRMLLLFIGSAVAFLALMLLLVWIGLNAMAGA